jgi:hypothetical protein
VQPIHYRATCGQTLGRRPEITWTEPPVDGRPRAGLSTRHCSDGRSVIAYRMRHDPQGNARLGQAMKRAEEEETTYLTYNASRR